MPSVLCKICLNKFYVKPFHQNKGWGIYCSKTCQSKGQRTGQIHECYICKKPTYKNLNTVIKSETGKFFCSKSCQTVWRNTNYSGNNHSNWKGGKASYRKILSRADVEEICAKCKNQDKRILAVHHKDKNRDNNLVSNLVWLCHNCHYLVHHHKDESEGFLVAIA